MRSKLVPGRIAIERCGGEERCRGEGAKAQDPEKVWERTGDRVGVRNLRIQRKCGREQVMGRGIQISKSRERGSGRKEVMGRS